MNRKLKINLYVVFNMSIYIVFNQFQHPLIHLYYQLCQLLFTLVMVQYFISYFYL